MGGRSSSSTAQASTNTDRSVVNDEGLVFADAVGMYTQSNSTSTNYTDASDNSSLVLDASVDASDRSVQLTTNTATTNTDSRNQSLYASDSRSFNTSTTDASDNSLFASDSSNRSFNSSTSTVNNNTDSRDQSLKAWDYSERTDRSVSTVNTNTLDGGAIGGAFKFSADIGNRALASLDSGIARTFGAFDKVIEASSKNTAAAMADTANFRNDVKTASGTAASEKAGQLDNKTIMILGVAVAAMVLLRR